jgi:hypothetical protein
MNARVVVPVILLVALVTTGVAFTQADGQQSGILYQWVDDQGNVHATDRPSDIPEKYRSRVKKIGSGSGGQEPVIIEQQAEPEPSEREENAQNDKAMWQQKIRDWKDRLADAETRYRSLEQERNGLFAAWGSPAVAPLAARQRAEQIDQQMQEVQQEIVKAKDMINNVIPEQARKAGIPPGWLRE